MSSFHKKCNAAKVNGKIPLAFKGNKMTFVCDKMWISCTERVIECTGKHSHTIVAIVYHNSTLTRTDNHKHALTYGSSVNTCSGSAPGHIAAKESYYICLYLLSFLLWVWSRTQSKTRPETCSTVSDPTGQGAPGVFAWQGAARLLSITLFQSSLDVVVGFREPVHMRRQEIFIWLWMVIRGISISAGIICITKWS